MVDGRVMADLFTKGGAVPLYQLITAAALSAAKPTNGAHDISSDSFTARYCVNISLASA